MQQAQGAQEHMRRLLNAMRNASSAAAVAHGERARSQELQRQAAEADSAAVDAAKEHTTLLELIGVCFYESSHAVAAAWPHSATTQVLHSNSSPNVAHQAVLTPSPSICCNTSALSVRFLVFLVHPIVQDAATHNGCNANPYLT